jgi:protein-tyrosine-phosphatase
MDVKELRSRQVDSESRFDELDLLLTMGSYKKSRVAKLQRILALLVL